MNVWAGRSDGTPPFTLIRGIPSIEEATVLTNGGKTVQVTLSPKIEEFGLRFGAAALPEDDPPEILSVRLGDGRVVPGRGPVAEAPADSLTRRSQMRISYLSTRSRKDAPKAPAVRHG